MQNFHYFYVIIVVMKLLEADIKKGIYRNIYVLWGVQNYQRNRYVKALTGIFAAAGDTMNVTHFSGRKIDIKEVLALADTMPFLAEKRVIVLEDTDLFSKACEELADYIPNIPESTVMIFSEEKIDMRLKQSKAVKSTGCIAEFGNLSEESLRDWIIKRLGKEHRPITGDALDLFMERCGNDMWEISNDLEKIISYTFGKDGIRTSDIEATIPAPPEDAIFAMIDAILAGQTQKALVYYTDLLALRSDPMGILSLLREQLRLLLHVKELDGEHMSTAEMAKLLTMREPRVRMALPAAKKSSKISLTQKVTMCADTDERIKSGLIDPQIGVETLILEMAGRK